ncbi:MAG: hypothetical protein COU35_01805 [Candidatus Magasanikbacteria bacterium CG10_big_fil_rev_8_21_14_0_10_47_10]|uniref:SbsA Ig-like domain-containing protein n=1 Tax=Candidatus Magasanikbacteria bacterium CG10_big_fil_rev_8_21_14_0_10_47_10 TaxID=1974652 RepID=A0A2H0TR26_9BACT|nr:MAG: hypothetical protein COU35_01805 [Candidatus Magasanikbacteria bacterium CG10_big_fil_rev_8_21_14_0_10_47_10]
MLPWIRQHKRHVHGGLLIVALFLIAAIFIFVRPSMVSAQANVGDTFGVGTVDQSGLALGSQDIRLTIAGIIRAFLGLLGIIAVVIVIYGGFVYMTSGGSEDKIAQAKKILINGAIGLFIIMSSFAITQFFISRLSEATGVGAGAGGAGAGRGPGFESFAGSGSLGSGIVQDHYPERGQQGVKRNTNILVTFSEPIDPASIIVNSNNTCVGDNGQATNLCGPESSPFYGDCFVPDGEVFNRAIHCDQLDTDAVTIVAAAQGDAPAGQPIQASALTIYEDGAARNAYTFTFKPLELLGSGEQNMQYIVDLKPIILRKDGTGAFEGSRSNHYEWTFQTDTTIDDVPPFVTNVYPGRGRNQIAPRNSIIQVSFSEPMDPTVVQGLSGPNTEFNHIIFGDRAVTGEWKLTNRYQTVEFVSDIACGQNSCGDVMYCLPTPSCADADEACAEDYEVLIRTADVINPDGRSFEAIPFSGVMDASGNALNGRSGDIVEHDAGEADGKPPVGLRDNAGNIDIKAIGDQERAEDNMWWTFGIRNTIDRTPPFISRVTPDIDQGRVPGDAPLSITFSERMWYHTLHRNVRVTEHPANLNGMDDIWFALDSGENDAGQTVVTVSHREFGPNGFDLYYFPSIASQVKDAQQNCLYPGRGPAEELSDCTRDDNGNYEHCTGVEENPVRDTSCVTQFNNIVLQPDTDTCLNILRQPEISPVSDQPVQ